MALQTLGTFVRTESGFEGRIQTLLSDLKLYIEDADPELQATDKAPDYVIKSKYSVLGHGWNGPGDDSDSGKVMGTIKLVLREPFFQSSIEATLTKRARDWAMEWDPFPEFRSIPLLPFKREPQIIVETEDNISSMKG